MKAIKSPPSEFRYGGLGNLESLEDWKSAKENVILYLKEYSDGYFDTTIAILEKNDYLIVEDFQGERVRGISINGVGYTLRLSPLKEGFFLNNEPLEYTTENLDEGTFYLHNIELVGY